MQLATGRDEFIEGFGKRIPDSLDRVVVLRRLSACVLIEAHDEWQVTDRPYLSEAAMSQLTPPAHLSLPATPAKVEAEEVMPAVAKTA